MKKFNLITSMEQYFDRTKNLAAAIGNIATYSYDIFLKCPTIEIFWAQLTKWIQIQQINKTINFKHDELLGLPSCKKMHLTWPSRMPHEATYINVS